MALHHRLIWRAARLWWRVRRPRTLGVRAIVLDPADRIVLVRHTYVARWHLPGGGVKSGERVEAAAVREVREETGLDVPVEALAGVFHNRAEYKDDHVVLFVTRCARPEALRASEGMEIAETGWFALDALPELSPATARRIAAWRAGDAGWGMW